MGNLVLESSYEELVNYIKNSSSIRIPCGPRTQ